MNGTCLTALLAFWIFASTMSAGLSAAPPIPAAPAPMPRAQAEAQAVESIASLADPEKLATLAARGANPRVQKIAYWLIIVHRAGGKPEPVIDAAFARFGWQGTPQGEETKRTLIRNFERALYVGCDTPEGMEEMRRGRAPTIRKGQFYGDELGVDHILPRAVVPSLDNVLANLELMPTQMNRNKSDKLEDRQTTFARRFVDAGLVAAAEVSWAAPFEKADIPPPPPKAPAPTPLVAPIGYAGSKQSEVFHKLNCSTLARIVEKNRVTYATHEAAIAAGKSPCAKCQP